MRGNINTRLKKLDEENFDAIVLAKAGLEEWKWTHLITQISDVESFVPAPGQGVLCIECLSQHQEILSKIKKIVHLMTLKFVLWLREFLQQKWMGIVCPQ